MRHSASCEPEAPTADGAAFVCRLARCRDAWLAQRMRANAAARASPATEPPSPAPEPSAASHGGTAAHPLEAFRMRPAHSRHVTQPRGASVGADGMACGDARGALVSVKWAATREMHYPPITTM